MRPRGPMQDGRARHFFHIENIGSGGGGGGCSGGGVGESEVHRKYKNHAVSKLRQLYPNFIAFCRPEQRLKTVLGDDFEELPSGKEDRQVDAMMLLEEATRTFGRGLIVEVQYRNLGKDIEETTRDYLTNGFSVLWLDEDDFESDRCLITKKQIRRNVISVWPNAVPQPMKWWGGGVPDPLAGVRDAIWNDENSPMGRSFTEVPAKLPDEYFDQKAQEIKKMFDWDSLFSPPADYTDIWCYSKVPATLPPEWHEEKAREFWLNEPWSARFNTKTPLWKYIQDEFHVEAEIPLNKFILDEPEMGYYRSLLRRSHHHAQPKSNSEEIWVSCNECGSGRSVTVVGGIPAGMTGYGTKTDCTECGEKTWHSP